MKFIHSITATHKFIYKDKEEPTLVILPDEGKFSFQFYLQLNLVNFTSSTTKTKLWVSLYAGIV